MNVKTLIKKEENNFKDILRRIIKRDFSGTYGLAIKNSTYQLLTTGTAKIGSLLFTIIVARLMLPELFGLYNLALSTVVFLGVFSDLGVGEALVRFVSKELGKRKGNPGGYFKHLLKIKVYLTSGICVVLLASSYFIANNYYNKPIFLALIAGVLYLSITTFGGFIAGIFRSHNTFVIPFKKEIILQVSRVVIVPLAILATIGYSNSISLFFVFIALSLVHAFALLYFLIKIPKYKSKDLSTPDKKEVNRFIIPLSVSVLSSVIYGYIDIIMLGHYVSSEFIGYYSAALSLVSSSASLLAFSGALFPLFSRMNPGQLNRAFRKAMMIVLPLSFLGVLAVLVLAKYAVLIVYGAEYVQAIPLLRIFSLILFVEPIIAITVSYFVALGRPSFVAKSLLFTSLLNIVLNYILITSLISGGDFNAVIGAAIATITSKFVYLFILILGKKKNKSALTN